MATLRKSVFGGASMHLDSGVFFDLIRNQLGTPATAPAIGDMLACWVADGASDNGFKFAFSVPKNYVGSPKLTIVAILDGAPNPTHTLGWGFRKRAVADNEAADGTLDAEQTVSATIGSSGGSYSDEDLIEQQITLTAANYAVDDLVVGYLYLDASATDYTGNVGIVDVLFEYTDA